MKKIIFLILINTAFVYSQVVSFQRSKDIYTKTETENAISDSSKFIYSTSELSSLSPTTGQRFVVQNTGGNYKIRVDSINGYSSDGITQIKTANGKFALLEPVGDSYLFSQAELSGSSDIVNLRRLTDYVSKRINASRSYWVTTDTVSSTQSTVLIDKDISLTDTLYLLEGVHLKSTYVEGSAYYEHGGIITIDINDSSKSAFTLKRSGYTTGSISDCIINVESPCYAVINAGYAYGRAIYDVYINGNGYAKNGIITGGTIFNTIENVRVSDVDSIGIWYKKQYGIGTTSFLSNVNVGTCDIGVKVDSAQTNSLNFSYLTVQFARINAIKIDGGDNNVTIDHFYTEALARSDSTMEIISVNNQYGTPAFGGRYSITNSVIQGTATGGYSGYIAIAADYTTRLNIVGNTFERLEKTITTTENTASVLFEGNHEGNVTYSLYDILKNHTGYLYGVADSSIIQFIANTKYAGPGGLLSGPYTKINSPELASPDILDGATIEGGAEINDSLKIVDSVRVGDAGDWIKYIRINADSLTMRIGDYYAVIKSDSTSYITPYVSIDLLSGYDLTTWYKVGDVSTPTSSSFVINSSSGFGIVKQSVLTVGDLYQVTVSGSSAADFTVRESNTDGLSSKLIGTGFGTYTFTATKTSLYLRTNTVGTTSITTLILTKL